MTWTKLSDDFSDDCWELSDAAFRLHAEGLIWSNRKLTDLCLDKEDLRRWAKRPEAAGELVERGWWIDRGDHYLIVHHGRYQRSRDVVLRLQQRNRQNGGSGGRPPKVPRERFPTKGTQVGSELAAQVETQRDGTGRDGPGQQGDHPQSATGICIDCNDHPATGLGWDADRCATCAAERAAEAAEVEP